MAQQYPNNNQSYRGGQSYGAPQGYYTDPQNQNPQQRTLTPQQRRARQKRRQELLRRRRRRKRALIGLLVLLLAVAGFVGIKMLSGSVGVPTEALDELDLDDLDDEAEEALYNGPPVATIAFVGDISASADQVKAVTLADNTFNFEPVFEDVKDYFGSDRIAYAVGDFETTIVDGLSYGGEPYYNAPVQLAGSLRRLGFRLMSTANTYALNNGIEGVASTKNYLTASKLRSVGTYLSQADRGKDGGAYIRDIHKIKFAFLSYTKGTDSVTMPEGCEYALNTLYSDYSDYWSELKSSQIRRDVQAARDAGAEVIVALVHWGSEYSRSVTTQQETVKDLLLSSGVDVIIGAHSHLVSTMEFEKVELSDGTVKQCFVAYGLGDFYTDPAQETAQQSLILNLTFARDDNGAVSITDASYVPVYNHIQTVNGVRQFHIIDVYRNLAELKRVDMTSEQAELYNQLLDTIDTMHNYGGEELDEGPAEKDRRIVEKAIAEGEIPATEIRALKKAERQAAQAAAQAAKEAKQNGETAPEEPEYE